jgi:phosphate transport system substrate-binding protein
LIVGAAGVFAVGWWWAMLPALILNAIYWYRYNSKHGFHNFKNQLLALVVSFIYYFGLLSVALAISHYNYLQLPVWFPAFFFPYNLTSLTIAVGMFYDNLGWMFIGTFWSALLGIGLYQARTKQLPKLNGKQLTGLVVLMIVSFLPIYQNFANNLKFTNSYGEVSSLHLSQYRPFAGSKHLVTVHKSTNLSIPSDYPKLNGATALYPVYSAAAQALYTGVSAKQGAKLIRVDSTPKAFNSLLKKKSDVIFMAKPSNAQFKTAKEKHVDLKLTKIGTEAFVFFVNQKNPVSNLSVKQIQSIYQQKTVFWSSVGGQFNYIQPFQRPEGSGGQTAMEQMVMKGRKMVKPMRYQEFDAMDGVVDGVAGYNNHTNAIGYSFRFFATQMMHNQRIKLIKINGVAPTPQNIRNGKYPLVGSFYAITRGHPSRNSRQLIAWLKSADGQSLINRTGYVGIKK